MTNDEIVLRKFHLDELKELRRKQHNLTVEDGKKRYTVGGWNLDQYDTVCARAKRETFIHKNYLQNN